MRTTLICGGLLLVSSFVLAAPRLALLPEDATPETATCLDLLTAALGQGASIDLVERTELRRVLEEQKLTAAGAVSLEQALALGKVLRAEGILFVLRDPAEKTLTMRLVETRQGLVAGFWRYRPGTDPVEKTVAQLAADIRAGAAKLATVGEKPLLVSILRVGNATLDADLLWIEDELPLLLGSLLTRDPRVLLLERRQLGQLLDETQTSAGGAAAFRTAGILLDADIALKPNVAIDPDRLKRAVVMTVRLRTPQLLELASVSVEGTAGQVDRLAAEAATQLLARLHELKSIPATGDTGTEAKLFLDIARQQGTTTAADAAHALVPGDEAALRKLLESLMRRVPPKTENDDAALRDATREWARNLGRAADLVRGRMDTPLGDAFAIGVLNDCALMKGQIYIGRKRARQDPEIGEQLRDALRPVGQVARLVLEHRRARWGDKIGLWEFFLTQGSFVDSDLEGVAYLEPLLLPKLDSKGDRSVLWRQQTFDIFSGLTYFSSGDVPRWRKWQGFLNKTLQRPEPDVRYYAHASLVLLEKDPTHLHEMARLLPTLFEGSDEWLASGQAGTAMNGSLYGVTRLWQS